MKLLLIFYCIQNFLILKSNLNLPIPVTARSKAWVCGRSPAGSLGSNPIGSTNICVLCVLHCQGEASTTVRPIVQKSYECGVSVHNLETSTLRRPRSFMAAELWKNLNLTIFVFFSFFKSSVAVHCDADKISKYKHFPWKEVYLFILAWNYISFVQHEAWCFKARLRE
jgi:hypothetical protein